jgi:transcriptional regulator with XRE-family HTH domain
MEIKEKFGARIKELRKDLGISQSLLGEYSSLDRTYISDIESGKRNVSIENIEKLANALKVTLEQLFKDL